MIKTAKLPKAGKNAGLVKFLDAIASLAEHFVTHGGTHSGFSKHLYLSCLSCNSFRPFPTSVKTFPSLSKLLFWSFLVHIRPDFQTCSDTAECRPLFKVSFVILTNIGFVILKEYWQGTKSQTPNQRLVEEGHNNWKGSGSTQDSIFTQFQNYFLRRGYGLICMMLLSTNTYK